MDKKILIAAGEEQTLTALAQIFESKYEIIRALGGKMAILEINNNINDIAVIIIDLIMTEIPCAQVLQILSARGITEKIPVFLITAESNMPSALLCYEYGVADIITKPFISQVVLKRVENIYKMQKSKQQVKDMLDNSNKQLLEQKRLLGEFYDKFTDAISNVIEFRGFSTDKHIHHVKGITMILARAYMQMYPEDGLTEDGMETIIRAASIHDIGKIAIPESILLKPGKLTNDEMEVMKSHTTKGCEILEYLGEIQDQKQYKVSYDVCRYHHERYDGKGYPDGLVGDDIPLSAQLVAIADVYDGLVSERIYKQSYSKDKAYVKVVTGECGQFNPKILECFKKSRNTIELFIDSDEVVNE